MVPPRIVLEPWLKLWLGEDIGRGDWAGSALEDASRRGWGRWIARAEGMVCGLPIAQQVFELLDPTADLVECVAEGALVSRGETLAEVKGPLGALLTGERLSLNLVMRLSGVATATRQYVDAIAPYAAQFVDTRKTTPGLRLLEKYATRVGGGHSHRMGLDDSVMLKDNHIAAAGSIESAVARVRQQMPYPLTIEVETESLEQVQSAVAAGADLIMLDNMPLEMMREAVIWIRQTNARVKIEASGNVSLGTICAIAETGVDYISSSGPVTRSHWLDLSMRIEPVG